MGSLKALQDWCRIECENYPDVDIKNMSTSFRDGLAFCALIHKHRPDLIDFHSLSKENVYENNRLAFEVAASKLGIPALLDPGDMVSTDTPDRLSVITYLSQYYLVFNNLPQAGPTRLKVSYVGVDPTHVTNKQSAVHPDVEPATSSLVVQTRAVHQSSTSLQSSSSRLTGECVCCSKPVHLLQRQVVEGQVYHRGCFRCRVCSSTLLPGSYREGDEPGSLVCSHNCSANQSARPDLSRQEEAGSMEHLPKVVTQEVTSQQEARLSPHAERPPQEVGIRSIESSPQGAPSAPQGGSSRPVPAPRRMLDSSTAPRPAPRTRAGKTLDTSDPSTPTGQSKSPPSPASASGSCRPKDHPWMCISNPGPWSRLPPALPLSKPTPSRSNSLSPLHGTGEWFWKKPAPGNPFEEDDDEEEDTVDEGSRTCSAGQGSMATSQSWSGARSLAKAAKSSDSASSGPISPEDARRPTGHGSGPVRAGAKAMSAGPGRAEDPGPGPDELGPSGSAGPGAAPHTGGAPDPEAASVGPAVLLPGAGSGTDLDNPSTPVTSWEVPDQDEPAPSQQVLGVSEAAGQYLSVGSSSRPFPRSVSVPAITPAWVRPSPPTPPTNGGAGNLSEVTNDSDLGSAVFHSKTCKENLADSEATPTFSIPKSKTFQVTTATRAPAPGHGFPLIKRKVQAGCVSPVLELQGEMGLLEKQMVVLEQRGVELERRLRGCISDQDEEDMLVDWFRLVQDKHKLVRRDAELVYLTKQTYLEERQADVEYGLRCLLNKPESEWSKDDRNQEQQLMEELVTVIEQRNQIVNSLEQDRQREKEEDLLLEAMIKRKDFQKEEEKGKKKSKVKFKPLKVLRIFGHKRENSKSKDSQKKS